MDKDKKEIDVTKHILVPEHIKLTKEEAEGVLSNFNISFKQLPSVLKKDKGIKHLNAEPGDIIKIIRKEGNKETIFFRGVM